MFSTKFSLISVSYKSNPWALRDLENKLQDKD